MKYRAEYTLSVDGIPNGAVIGESIAVAAAQCQFTSVDLERRIVHLDVTIRINSEELSLETGPEPLDGSRPQAGLIVPSRKEATRIAVAFSRALAFAWGCAVRLSTRESEIIPETDLDRAVLTDLGTDRPLVRLGAQFSVIAPKFAILTSAILSRLLEREVGLALYNDAVSHSHPVARYREFWRVLEAAFGADNEKLLALIAAFPPAQQLGFSLMELKELLVIRGRASHAQSSSGLTEYDSVRELVAKKVERVRCLAEQVLLTKRHWGRRDLAVEHLASLPSMVRSDGVPVLFTKPGATDGAT